jgi:hypothetical protein
MDAVGERNGTCISAELLVPEIASLRPWHPVVYLSMTCASYKSPQMALAAMPTLLHAASWLVAQVVHDDIAQAVTLRRQQIAPWPRCRGGLTRGLAILARDIQDVSNNWTRAFGAASPVNFNNSNRNCGSLGCAWMTRIDRHVAQTDADRFRVIRGNSFFLFEERIWGDSGSFRCSPAMQRYSEDPARAILGTPTDARPSAPPITSAVASGAVWRSRASHSVVRRYCDTR